MKVARSLTASGLLAVAALALSPGVGAQQVYRIVGPDGRVTFSDKPPPDPGRATAAPVVPQGAAGGGSALPFELRQVAGKYPVTLYTGSNCVPCGAGKAFLASRGIPFTERTVSSNEDIDALQRLAGDASLPLLMVGAQQIRGYSDAEWAQFLDAAGYPKTSLLPASFRNPPAAPLVAIQRPAAAPASAGEQAGAQPATVNRRFGTTPGSGGSAAAPAPAPANPAGIRF